MITKEKFLKFLDNVITDFDLSMIIQEEMDNNEGWVTEKGAHRIKVKIAETVEYSEEDLEDGQ